jgi:DNA-binding winged helix-turn-helix (wHTH) protein/Tol biopolymer transport system component
MSELPQNGHATSGNGSGNGSRNGFNPVRFADFEADLRNGEIRKAGNRIKLQEQPFKVLQILLEKPGSLVSREELQARIWPEESFGDFDHAVNVAVAKLRTALGDSADEPYFIETVPRRGYRFVAAVVTEPTELPAATAPVASDPDDSRQSSKRFKARRLLYVFLAILGSGVLVAAGVWLGHRSTSSQPAEIQRLTINHGTVYSARFAPDGHNVIYAASWKGQPIEVFSTDVKFSGSRSLGLTGTDLLAVSSSGEMAVLQQTEPQFLTGMTGTLGQVPLTGGTPRQIAERIDWADWSPDGKTLAVVHEVAGKERIEFPLGHVLYETSGWIGHVRVSPSGRAIAFLDHPIHDDDEGEVSIVDLEGRRTTLSTGWESTEGLAWSPNGKEIWFSATRAGLEMQIYAVDLVGHLRPTFHALGGVTLLDIAPDGRVLMTRDEHRAGIVGEGPGVQKEQDLAWLDWSIPMDISRDGKTLLFDEQGAITGPNYTVAMRDMTGSSPPVALGEGVAGHFSPDGKWAAATVSYNQLVLLPTGAGNVKRIDRGDIQQYGYPIQWMPDGKQLLFAGYLAGRAAQCFVQSIDGGRPRAVTPEGVAYCKISPDGKLVAASDTKWNEAKLYSLDGGAPRPIPGLQPGESVEWTSDPNFIYVIQGAKSRAWIRVFRMNLFTGQRKLFKEFTAPDGAGFCEIFKILFSPDGRAYAYGYVRLLSDLYLVTGVK